MKITIFAAVLLAGLYAVTGAVAEEASPTPTPTETPAPAASPAPPKMFYLEVDPNDLALISQAINELPKRVADPLVLKLNAQLQAQAKITENKEAAEKPKKSRK